MVLATPGPLLTPLRNGTLYSAASPQTHAEFTFACQWLIHPHLVHVLELDIAAGYLSMEFVDSGPSAELQMC
jgi:hypothetical protein